MKIPFIEAHSSAEGPSVTVTWIRLVSDAPRAIVGRVSGHDCLEVTPPGDFGVSPGSCLLFTAEPDDGVQVEATSETRVEQKGKVRRLLSFQS